VLAQAVEQAGGFDAKALTAALDDVKGFEGWTGSTHARARHRQSRAGYGQTVDEINDEGAFTVDPAWAKAIGAPY
jgi:ABC-type branched-subunit amino acid transport system substrate-binding protein